jgi:sec-independent protein translocase protein TatA
MYIIGYILLIAKPPGILEIALIAFIILILFGGRKIPEIMKGLGKGITEFKKGVKDEENKSEKSED